jgi:hypothetical protein
VHLVGFIIRKFHDAQLSESQITYIFLTDGCGQQLAICLNRPSELLVARSKDMSY